MTYELLEKAPKDHLSEEFLQFLRENNEVVEETFCWLIIANCKYDKPEKRWYTAFLRFNHLGGGIGSVLELMPKFGHLEWLKKASGDQSVKRFHIHLYEVQKL